MIKLIDMKNISISLIIFVVTILFFSNVTGSPLIKISVIISSDEAAEEARDKSNKVRINEVFKCQILTRQIDFSKTMIVRGV